LTRDSRLLGDARSGHRLREIIGIDPDVGPQTEHVVEKRANGAEESPEDARPIQRMAITQSGFSTLA
jgi:hypothetical protein